MSNIRELDDLRPHFNVMALCLSEPSYQEICHNRWIATVVSGTSLFRLECPRCGAFNSFASFLTDEYLEQFNKGVVE